MKINEIKHNHSLTDLLKVLLYSILMLLPFIDVGVRCGYVMLNKNAYQSYSGQETIQYENIDNVSNLQIGKTYHFNARLGTYDNTSQNNTNRIYYSNVSNLETSNNYIEEKLLQGNNFNLYYSTTTLALYFYDNETNIGSTSITTYECQFDFVLNGYIESAISNNMTFMTYKNMSNYNYIDNVFEYSVNKLESSNLYNWTTQTAIYSGVSTMTTQLGITTNIIPMVLCYWFFITIIYIILDIVIKLFTILTHFIGSKTSS